MNGDREHAVPMADDTTSMGIRPPAIQWNAVIIAVLSALLSAAITYGVVITKVNYLEERVKQIEQSENYARENYLTREEYIRSHQRLEDKVDQLIEMHIQKK
jgi:hypothetical protein